MNTVYVISALSGIQGFQNGGKRAEDTSKKLCSCLLFENRLIEVNIDSDSQSLLGSIYVGKVKHVLKSIDAAFVEIAGGRTCFLPLAKARCPVLTNRTFDGRILAGDEILVQVERDAVKTKDPVLTAKLSVTGKYVSVSLDGMSADMPLRDIASRDTTSGEAISPHSESPKQPASGRRGVLRYSRQLSEESRQRLAGWLKGQNPPAGMVAVIRTQAQELTEPAPLKQELSSLSGQLERLLQTGRTRTVFSLLTDAVPEYIRRLKKSRSFPDKIVTDELSVFQTLQSYFQKEAPEKCDAITFYEDEKLSLSALYGLGGRLSEAFSKNVWLKSGGYLVIEPTEALTVIDVNSGKYDGKKKAAQTFFLINEEAAAEVARQLRLRNLSGMILVDFINMDGAGANRQLLDRLRELCRQDPAPVQVLDITALGLVELTRKKVSRPLAEQLAAAGFSLKSEED